MQIGFKQVRTMTWIAAAQIAALLMAVAGASQPGETNRTTISTVPLEQAAAASSVRPDSESGQTVCSEVMPLDGTSWLLAVDPKNVGRQEQWFETVREDAKVTQVPWIIQDAFPDYHGVAWYWREFQAPANPHPGGRYLLRFHAVDYLAEVWVNGVKVGSHEGAEDPFVLDATAAVQPGTTNLLAVRVLNPTWEPIDGVRLQEVAEGRREYPVPVDNAYHTGGIIDSVELVVAPAVRIEDLHVMPDWKTGDIRIRVKVRNAGEKSVRGRVQLAAAPATGGESVATGDREQNFAPGDTLVETRLRVPHHRLWELDRPYLYRVTARAQSVESSSVDERSTRCGFRDFRFENGYFRFNGRRIRLHGALYIILHYPVSMSVPFEEQLFRRDALHMKEMGFNIVRITCGGAVPARQLDLFDELGLLVSEEHFGADGFDQSKRMAESPLLEKRFDESITSVIRRDRNHPCIVSWGLLNETREGRLFRRAVGALDLIRSLDDDRMILLGSGRWDGDQMVGSLSNPGSRVWESNLRDVHSYPVFPHSADTIRGMRGEDSLLAGAGEPASASKILRTRSPMLLSEYGLCGAQNYARFMRRYEQLGKESAADARIYRKALDRFLSDWKKWQLDQCWARPEDYFLESQRNQAALALDDYNAWMANPSMVGSFTSTGIVDAWFHGCGITDFFRQLKPGMADAYNDMAAPIRLCLFVEPITLYRGANARLEAVLVNLDALKPGTYPVRLQVVGPKMTRVLEKTILVEVPESRAGAEPPFVQPVFGEDVIIDGPAGKYRFLATFERGAAAGGGDVDFYVDDPAGMPSITGEVVLWGEDEELDKYLSRGAIRHRKFAAGDPTGRELILASGKPPAPGGAPVFAELARQIARGSSVVFLTPQTLMELKPGERYGSLRWAPLPKAQQARLTRPDDWYPYFRPDHWAKEHPIFTGLACGGIMNYRLYRNLIRPTEFAGLQPPAEAVCGTIQTSGRDFPSHLLVCVQSLGAGRFILNSLSIRENLGTDPVAERLLRNLLNFAAPNTNQPLAELPEDFLGQLKAMGYE